MQIAFGNEYEISFLAENGILQRYVRYEVARNAYSPGRKRRQEEN